MSTTCAQGIIQKKQCTTHYIKKDTIKAIILNDLQTITTIAKQFEDSYLLQIMLKDIQNELDNNDNKHIKIDKNKYRIDEIDMIIKKLYEDNVMGKISDDRFMQLNDEYETEQKQLKDEVEELQQNLDRNRFIIKDKKDFLHLIRKYTDIHELSYDVVRELIDKIVVYKQVPKGEVRKIDIHYRFAGKVNINQLAEQKNETQ